MTYKFDHSVLFGAAAVPLTAPTFVSTVLGLLNIFVGLMIVAAALFFFGGLIVWAVLLGQVGRTQGIELMEWGVVILFVLSVLLAVVQFFQASPAASTFVVSALIVCGVLWTLISVAKGPEKEKKEERPK